MKIKNGYILRKVGTQNVVVAVGEASRDFNGIIRLNETGRFLWQQLSQDKTEEQLTAALLDAYDVDKATAEADVKAFVQKLEGADLVD